MGSLSERTYDIGNLVAYVEVTDRGRRVTHLLDDQCDGTLLYIGTGNGEGYTLALLAETYYNEVARLA